MYNPLRKLRERMLLPFLCGKPRRARCRSVRKRGGTSASQAQAYAEGEARTLRSLPRMKLLAFFPAAYATGCTKIAHPALYPRHNIHSYPRYNTHPEYLRQGCTEPRSGDICTTRCASCGKGCFHLPSAASLGERDAAVCVSVGTRQTIHAYATARQDFAAHSIQNKSSACQS